MGKATFEGVTGAPVLVDEFEPDPARGAFPGDPAPDHAAISHLELVRRCDAYAIAPASANTLAKLAGGHADNLLLSAALASTKPLVLAPAMNNHMWEHPATRGNVETLRLRGATIVEPGTGRSPRRASGARAGWPSPPRCSAEIERALAGGFAPRSLDGLRVLVTAGGTREPIDSVRYVGNRSSGRMGVEVAREARRRGAEVTLIAANVALELPEGVRVDRAWRPPPSCATPPSAEFPAADVLVMAAAVSDFRPASAESTKIKKAGRDGLSLELEPTDDVLAALSGLRRSAGRR